MLFATAELSTIGVVVADVVAFCGLASALRIAMVEEGVSRLVTRFGDVTVDAFVEPLVPDV